MSSTSTGQSAQRYGVARLRKLKSSPNWYIEAPILGTENKFRKSTGRTDEGEAQAELATWVLKTRGPDVTQTDAALVGPLVKWYLDTHASKAPSRSGNRTMCANVIEFFGAHAVAELNSKKLIASFIDHERKRGLRDGSINRELAMLRAAMIRAHDHELLAERPPKINAIREDDFTVPTQEAQIFTLEQLRDLLMRSVGFKNVFRCLIIMIATACRPSAAIDLTPRQVDFDSGLIDLNPPGRKQNKKYRPMVRLPDTLRPLLKQWAETDFLKPTDPYVRSGPERPEKELESIRGVWNRLVRGNGGMGLDGRYIPYSVRHTIATELNRRGAPEKEIGIQLGHIRGEIEHRMTKRYVRSEYRPEYQAVACKMIDEILADVLKFYDGGNVVGINSRKVGK